MCGSTKLFGFKKSQQLTRYTVLKVGYKHDLLIFEIFLRLRKMCGRTKLLGF